MCIITRPECVVCGWKEGCLFRLCNLAWDMIAAFSDAGLVANEQIWCSEPPQVRPVSTGTQYVCIPCRYEAQFLAVFRSDDAVAAVEARVKQRERGGPAAPFEHTSLREMAPFMDVVVEPEKDWGRGALPAHWVRQQYRRALADVNWREAVRVYGIMRNWGDETWYWERRARLSADSKIVGWYTNCKRCDEERAQTYVWKANEAAVEMAKMMGRGGFFWCRASTRAEAPCGIPGHDQPSQ